MYILSNGFLSRVISLTQKRYIASFCLFIVPTWWPYQNIVFQLNLDFASFSIMGFMFAQIQNILNLQSGGTEDLNRLFQHRNKELLSNIN